MYYQASDRKWILLPNYPHCSVGSLDYHLQRAILQRRSIGGLLVTLLIVKTSMLLCIKTCHVTTYTPCILCYLSSDQQAKCVEEISHLQEKCDHNQKTFQDFKRAGQQETNWSNLSPTMQILNSLFQHTNKLMKTWNLPVILLLSGDSPVFLRIALGENFSRLSVDLDRGVGVIKPKHTLTELKLMEKNPEWAEWTS